MTTSVGPFTATEIDAGSQRVAGASVGSSPIFRGPVRRSRSAAMDVRQLFAIIWRCASVICTWSNFSASENVAAETSGPTGGAVLNAGGAPGVGAVDVVPPAPDFCSSARQAATAPSSATGA